MKTRNKIFSAKRLRQVLNDLKRRPEDAARELKISNKKIINILKGKDELKISLVKRMLKIWPVTLNNFINFKFFNDKDPEIIIFNEKSSKKTSRLMQRKGRDYYEYRDTAMSRNAPFRPEWIRVLQIVDNNNPKNPKVVWNKGHLLHQFTYFVGNINFYYFENKIKKVKTMKTGDTMYISPYVPHSFTSRDNDRNFIIALTYLDKITNDVQDNLGNLGIKNSMSTIFSENSNNDIIKRYTNNSFLNFEEIIKGYKTKNFKKNSIFHFSKKLSDKLNINLRDILETENTKKVIISTQSKSRIWFYPTKKKRILQIRELASSKYSPESKSFELSVLKSNNIKHQNHSHQYFYVLGKYLKLKINSKIYNLKKNDSFYLKPFTKFSLMNNNAKILVLRVSDRISGDNLLQLSQIGKENIKRVIKESESWF